MNQEQIGKFIAELRKEKNLTQSDIAEKLGSVLMLLVNGKGVFV